MGERGSPCLRPRWCVIISLGSPFTNACVEEVDRIRHNKSHHRCPNPSCRNTSNRNDQDTESKSFEISNLSKMWAYFFLCRDFTICCTNKKLSWIFLPLTKALWFVETKDGKKGASRLAIILITNLAKLWMRLIGLKSFTWTASIFFGSKVMKAELRSLNLNTWPR
jgi:hypothetical protein